MYFYHKVISDALSVNEKYRNVRERLGRGKHTLRDTLISPFTAFFWPGVNCSEVIRIIVLVL